MLEGTDPTGAAIVLPIGAPTLVLALATTCDGCVELAGVVRDGVDGFVVVGLLRPPDGGLPDPGVDRFVGPSGHWVLGDSAFASLGVTSAPFFCVLDEHRTVLVEGVAFGRAHLVEHCARALAGRPTPDAVRLSPS
jgi:hypothetical protein